jgi:hypothetical protein
MFLRISFSESDDCERNKIVSQGKKKHSENETSSEDSDNTSNAEATMWVKEGKTPNYFQNQGNYDSSSKGFKWVDVSVVCATHKKKKGVELGTFVSSA